MDTQDYLSDDNQDYEINSSNNDTPKLGISELENFSDEEHEPTTSISSQVETKTLKQLKLISKPVSNKFDLEKDLKSFKLFDDDEEEPLKSLSSIPKISNKKTEILKVPSFKGLKSLSGLSSLKKEDKPSEPNYVGLESLKPFTGLKQPIVKKPVENKINIVKSSSSEPEIKNNTSLEKMGEIFSNILKDNNATMEKLMEESNKHTLNIIDKMSSYSKTSIVDIDQSIRRQGMVIIYPNAETNEIEIEGKKVKVYKSIADI